MKKSKSTAVLLFLVMLLGLSLILYPSFSNYINHLHQTRVTSDYLEGVSGMKEEDLTAYYEKAQEYNEKLKQRSNGFALSDDLKKEYEETLILPNTDVMAVVEIPNLNVTLPIYHGTSDEVLQRSVGHIEWSSLPIGGEGTHSVLCGHRGLPSSRLFTDLDKMEVGDTFTVTVLNQVLTYEVDQIRIVEPHDVEDLAAVPGEDYCTLQTCTPYGINTHRLLVRGRRIETKEDARNRIRTEALRVEPMVVASFLAVPVLLLLFLFMKLFPGLKYSDMEEMTHETSKKK